MLGLLLTLMALFSAADSDVIEVSEPTATHTITIARPCPDPFPGLVDVTFEVAYDERTDPHTGEVFLVPLGGVPYHGEIDERGFPVED